MLNQETNCLLEMAPVSVVVDSYLHFRTEIDDDDDDDDDNEDGDGDNSEYFWKQFNTSVGEKLMTKIGIPIISSRGNLLVTWINESVLLFSIKIK